MINPFNKDFLTAWHARDRLYAKIAEIKTIPASEGDIQFKLPNIRTNPEVPTDTMYMLAPRRENETDEEWASRCVIMTNIGESK
jgi:hypothetical protein